MIRIHAKDTATALIQIAHNVTGIFVRNSNLHGNDWLKEYRRCVHKAFLKCQNSCHLKCHLRGIYRMIGSVIKSSLHTYYRICSQRSLLNAFLKSLLNCREVVLRNCTANYNLLKYIWSLHITGRLKAHLNMTILSVSAGLFLMLSFYIRILANSLTERNLRFGKLYVYFIAILQHADNNVKMLVAHAINKALAVRTVILNADSLILAHDLGQSLGNLILITFIYSLKSLIGIRCGKDCLRIKHRIGFASKAVASLNAYQLGNGADITCMEFRNLDRLGTLKNI